MSSSERRSARFEVKNELGRVMIVNADELEQNNEGYSRTAVKLSGIYANYFFPLRP